MILLAAVLEALFLATCLLWVRSYTFDDGIARESYSSSVDSPGSAPSWMETCVEICSSHGTLGIYVMHVFPNFYIYPSQCPPTQFEWSSDYSFTFPQIRRDAAKPLGFVYIAGGSPPTTYWAIGIPHWIAAIVFAFFPIRLVARWLGKRDKAQELVCEACGYDLRATPDRCPECGAFVAKASKVPSRTVSS